jgi:hypothetical protein
MNKTAPQQQYQNLNMKTGIERKGDSIFIPVAIQFEKNTAVELSLTNTTKNEKTKKLLNKMIFDQIFYTDSSGWLYYSNYLRPSDSIKTLVVKSTAKQKVVADTILEQSVIVNLNISNGSK